MLKSRPPYPQEFRAEAVRLVREAGRSINQTARELGCATESLRAWLRQADLDSGRRTDGLASSEKEELRRLMRNSDQQIGEVAEWPGVASIEPLGSGVDGALGR